MVALAVVMILAAGLLLAPRLLPWAEALLPALSQTERVTALAAVGGMIALGALAWSAARGVLPSLRLRA
jgi:hypothetical protein